VARRRCSAALMRFSWAATGHMALPTCALPQPASRGFRN
jgi:hypothetical protein